MRSPVELLAPSGLWLLALLAPLVVLYILKVRRQRRAVASTWLWATAQRDLMARSPFKRLIAQIPLFVQAFALILLAVALSRPASRSQDILGDHVAIIIDASASMSATAPKPGGASGETTTRMELARQTALEVAAALTPGSDAMIIEAARGARLVSPLERDRRRVAQAIATVAARDVEGDLGAAVALASDRLRPLGGTARIVVITDGNLAHPGSLTAASIPIEVVKVGEVVDNAGIVRVDVRSGASPVDRREEVQVFAVVANYGRSPRDLFVTLREENASDVLASRRVLVAPGERQPVVLTFNPTRGDYGRGLIAEIAPHDVLAVDDVAYARVPAGDRLPVYLASAGGKPSPWLARAFSADATTLVHESTLAELLAAPAVPFDALVVVEGACATNAPGGDLLLVAPPEGACFGATVGPKVDSPALTSWDTADARLRYVMLDGVRVKEANVLTTESARRSLIGAREGAIAVDASTPAREVTVLGFDVGESDWPLKASFVLFVRNLIEQARLHRARGITGQARVGEPMRLTLPYVATKVEVTGPDGKMIEVVAREGQAVVPEIERAGLYHVSWQGEQAGSMVVAANLTSDAESDLREVPLLTTSAERASATVRDASDRPEAHTDWTWAFAFVALGLVLFDVWFATRARKVVPGVAPTIARRA